MDVLFWGFLLRVSQAFVSSAPTLVIGLLVAAIFERVLGRIGTLNLFGGRTWRQLPQAWLLGMLLPVCSLGAIPIMLQMKRSRILGGTILAFGLTAPLFNPISVLYGLTLSDPLAILTFSLCSLAIVTIMGTVWDKFFATDDLNVPPLAVSPFGWRRIVIVVLSAGSQLVSWTSLYIGIGLLGVGLLSLVLPPGVLQRAAQHDDSWAPVTMAGVSTLAYVTPMVAINQVAVMFEHGNSIGAAFTLLVLGTGVNLGTVVWTGRHFGFKRTLIWMALLLVVVLTIGYSVDSPLYPTGVEPADHTHAFDSYCQPFLPGTVDLARVFWEKITDDTQTEELVSLGFLAMLFVAGLLENQFKLIDRLVSNCPEVRSGVGRYDIVLPNSVIATATLGGLVLLSVVSCFVYYPPHQEVFREMKAINADIYSSTVAADWEAAARLIPIQEDWAHKLAVGGYLRNKRLTRFQAMKLKVYKEKLELLEHAIEDREREESSKFASQMAMAYHRLNKAMVPMPTTIGY